MHSRVLEMARAVHPEVGIYEMLCPDVSLAETSVVKAAETVHQRVHIRLGFHYVPFSERHGPNENKMSGGGRE